jgi:tetraacyldisaccharide 4'-kinase
VSTRRAIEHWLQAIWYDGAPAPFTLRLLALVYRVLAMLRRWLYRLRLLRTVKLPVPVIVIGNLSVGGTGKTPVTLWLCRELQALGLRIGIVLRGYGGSAAAPQFVGAGSDAARVGDEALLLQQRSGALVVIGRERVAAARLLIAAGAQVVIADDGLQHLRLGRAAEVAVIDGQRGFGNGRLLPAGPLREPVSRLRRVSAVVQNGGERLLVPGALHMQLAGERLWPVAAGTSDAARSVSLADFSGQTVHAIAGIGNPARFFALLRAAGLVVREHAFPDHHAFTAMEIGFEDALPVLMTEKDAVKCRSFAVDRHWFLPVSVEFAALGRQQLLRRLLMDARLLEILVCPLCKGPLRNERARNELVCAADRLAFPVREGIPVMLEEEARVLAADDPLLQR